MDDFEDKEKSESDGTGPTEESVEPISQPDSLIGSDQMVLSSNPCQIRTNQSQSPNSNLKLYKLSCLEGGVGFKVEQVTKVAKVWGYFSWQIKTIGFKVNQDMPDLALVDFGFQEPLEVPFGNAEGDTNSTVEETSPSQNVVS